MRGQKDKKGGGEKRQGWVGGGKRIKGGGGEGGVDCCQIPNCTFGSHEPDLGKDVT